MNCVIFRVDGVPVAQGRPRMNTKTRSVYDPVKSEAYKHSVGLAARIAMSDKAPLEGAVAMFLTINREIPSSWSKKKRKEAVEGAILPKTKPDISNYLKGIEDALNGICYLDDSQIVACWVEKRYSEHPGVEIIINQIKG